METKVDPKEKVEMKGPPGAIMVRVVDVERYKRNGYEILIHQKKKSEPESSKKKKKGPSRDFTFDTSKE